LRYLLDDIPEQASAVEAILKGAAAGRLALRVNVMVIAAVIWTCESYFSLYKKEIRDKVLMILNTPGLEVEDKDLMAEAILLYVDQNLDYIAAYNACWMRTQGIAQVYTFDERHYRRLEGIETLAPGA
jgi:predicted nucleic-acid-binding protein